ncbi:porin family protein [Tellurirhabdus rosea]|uniref:porin family protein n=1 Tax=Tellurirhabdus rosea TaxID=2674997 RepID=UPI002259DA15|nr:porin family protein [Tellurirhabdus rosea]
MKKMLGHVLAATALLTGLITQDAAAQTRARSGIKGGFNASTLNIENGSDRKERYGFHVGVFTQVPLGETFAIQPELLYTSKGASAAYNAFGATGRTNFNLNYLELPVLATFKLGNTADLQIGPYAGYLLNSSLKTEGDLGTAVGSLNTDNFNRLDYGVAGGFNLYFGPLLVGLRYGQGLNKVADSGGANLLLGNAKNATGMVSVGFAF